MYTPEDVEALTSQTKEKNAFVVVKDHAFDDILEEVYAELQALKTQMRPAKMSRGDQTWEDNNVRGDSLCWVTPALCAEQGLVALQQYVDRIKAECHAAMQAELGLGAEYNIQFAMYPGKGESYNRHKDAFSDPKADHARSSRQLTCLLYLNKDWGADDGGQLRVFTAPGVVIDNAGEPFSFWGVSGYDIDPLFGRMVIFRSELIDHAVLPCRKERLALTFWLNGTGPEAGATAAPKPMVFKFTPDNSGKAGKAAAAAVHSSDEEEEEEDSSDADDVSPK
jgi:Rps23 Pro-64 3,4-dihydroxylase Tpa1-like proline 4-hydroxylase